MSRHRLRSLRELVEADLEILPLMNLFVVLIPMLLLSAVFLELSVIHMAAPGEGAEASVQESLDLAIHIRDEAYRIRARGMAETEIPRTGRGDPEAIARLTEALAAVVVAHPENRSVRIVSRPQTRYEEIIEVMDRSREVGLPEASLEAAE